MPDDLFNLEQMGELLISALQVTAACLVVGISVEFLISAFH